MKLSHVGAIITATTIILGFAMLLPFFFRINTSKQITFVLTFTIHDVDNVSEWCDELSFLLKNNDIKATVFFAGSVANLYPECVSSFSENVDIGSQTYNYVNLTAISDYSIQLEEVSAGKQAVDNAGNLDSRLFKAPYGTTDENIYSLLTRSNILADFSYDDHYNKYYNGQFIRSGLTTYNGTKYTTDFLLDLFRTEEPIVILFDSATSIEKIEDFVLRAKSVNIQFTNASGITGLRLTIRAD